MPTAVPTVTVITVVRNGAPFIAQTVESVLVQNYPALQYIVIDGQSTDGTLAALQPYAGRIHRIVSGPDAGIFDAMNTGVEMASGAWVNFMNAGDWFAHVSAVSDAMQAVEGDCDAVYGDHYARYRTRQCLVRASDCRYAWRGIPFCHQTLFARRELWRDYPFQLQWKYAADGDFVWQHYRRGRIFRHCHRVLVSADHARGHSREFLAPAFWESWCIAAGNDGRWNHHLWHAARFLVVFLTDLSRRFLPAVAFDSLMWCRHTLQNVLRSRNNG